MGFGDEVWWSRLAQPQLHTWGGEALRLLGKARAKTDLEPKALACYGLLRDDTGRMLLRFVDGRPVSAVTIEFLVWAAARLAEEGKRVLVLVWDNAAWHVASGAQLDSRAQPSGQARGRVPHPGVSTADQESVARIGSSHGGCTASAPSSNRPAHCRRHETRAAIIALPLPIIPQPRSASSKCSEVLGQGGFEA